MRCKTCDYPLWNLATRACPECGSPFLPRDFDFFMGAVQFRCPHCAQAYYGTSPRGHLVPEAFNCCSCGEWVTADEMVLLPTDGVAEDRTRSLEMPWLERGRIGQIRGWLRTVLAAMASPVTLARSIPGTSSVFQAWVFAAISQTIFAAANILPAVTLFGVGMLAGPGGGMGGPGMGMMAVMMLGMAVGGVAATLVLMALWAATTHGLLRATGPTAGGIGYTARAICYSSGANALIATPCCGQYFAWVWWLVSAVLMVQQHQRVSGVRAAVAVLAPPLVLIAAVVGVYAIIITNAVAAATSAGMAAQIPPAPVASTSAGRLHTALRDYCSDHDSFPAHGVELFEHAVSGADFLAPGSPLTSETVFVEDVPLIDIAYLRDSERAELAEDAAAALPAGVVAHRIGDVVFTYHGLGVGWPPADGGVWRLVVCPDTARRPSRATEEITVIDGSGRVRAFGAGDVQTQLRNQNILREAAGLAPLPDPRTITTFAVPAP